MRKLPAKKSWRRRYAQKFRNINKFLFFILSGHKTSYNLFHESRTVVSIYQKLTPVHVYSICCCFISRGFTIKQKLTTLLYHHFFLEQNFKSESLSRLFKGGITCYSEMIHSGKIDITLKVNQYFFNEGALSLVLSFNGKTIFWLFFTIAPKSLLGGGEDVIIISSVHLKGKNYTDARTVTKEIHEIAPGKLLLYSLAGIAKALNIGQFLGISTNDHILREEIKHPESFNKSYDEFWEKLIGFKKENLGYVASLPLKHKPMEDIKQNHRNRAMAKKNKLEEISSAVTRETSLHLLPGPLKEVYIINSIPRNEYQVYLSQM